MIRSAFQIGILCLHRAHVGHASYLPMQPQASTSPRTTSGRRSGADPNSSRPPAQPGVRARRSHTPPFFRLSLLEESTSWKRQIPTLSTRTRPKNRKNRRTTTLLIPQKTLPSNIQKMRFAAMLLTSPRRNAMLHLTASGLLLSTSEPTYSQCLARLRTRWVRELQQAPQAGSSRAPGSQLH